MKTAERVEVFSRIIDPLLDLDMLVDVPSLLLVDERVFRYSKRDGVEARVKELRMDDAFSGMFARNGCWRRPSAEGR